MSLKKLFYENLKTLVEAKEGSVENFAYKHGFKYGILLSSLNNNRRNTQTDYICRILNALHKTEKYQYKLTMNINGFLWYHNSEFCKEADPLYLEMVEIAQNCRLLV